MNAILFFCSNLEYTENNQIFYIYGAGVDFCYQSRLKSNRLSNNAINVLTGYKLPLSCILLI